MTRARAQSPARLISSTPRRAGAADGDAVEARDHRLVELADAQDRLLREMWASAT
jgi:hypothetical protein